MLLVHFVHMCTVLHTLVLLVIVEFQKLWRSVPVDSIDEEKIEEYLKKQGISSMQETGPKKAVSVFYLSRNASLTHTTDTCTESRNPIRVCSFCVPCSYQSKRERSKVGRGRDTLKPTTTTWQEYWRTIQRVCLSRSEIFSLSICKSKWLERERERPWPHYNKYLNGCAMSKKVFYFSFFALLSDQWSYVT